MGIKKLLIIVNLCLLTQVGLLGCAALLDAEIEIRSGAYILERNSGWKLSSWHYSTWGGTSDVLRSRDITIAFYFSREKQNEFFKISARFLEVKKPIDVNPSRITLTLGNGETLRGKALSPNNPKWDLGSMRLYSTLEEPITIEKEDKRNVIGKPGFALFFDHFAPPVEEEFVMYMNDALTSIGQPIRVPPIYFRKKIERIYRLGCIM